MILIGFQNKLIILLYQYYITKSNLQYKNKIFKEAFEKFKR